MPKSLHEINSFNLGVMLNASERDLPDDSPSFSLNINPLSNDGVLDSIKNDRLFFTSDDAVSTIATPISWNSSGISDNTFIGPTDTEQIIQIDDIDIFQNRFNTKLEFIGTKGRKENLVASNIHPWYEKLIVNSTLNASFVPSATISETDDQFTYLSSTNAITKNNLPDGDITVSGFTDGSATITLLDATRTNYDTSNDNYFTIITPDNRSISYIFDDSTATSATGTTGGGYTIIGMSDVTENVTAIATNVKNAIEHANGHGGRISITQASGVLTLTYVHDTLNNYIEEGDYISFGTSSYASTLEIMQVEEIDTANRIVKIQRACFGRAPNSFSTSSTYNIYANRQTIDGTQNSTSKCFCTLSGWSSYAGNNIGGNSHYLVRCGDDNDMELYGGRINTATANQSATFSATNKTITFGSSITDIPFNEGDHVTFYNSANATNHGFSATILKKTTSPCVLTLDTAPTDQTMTSGYLYTEANLIKNHTFHHGTTITGQTVGASSEYKVNDWAHIAYKDDSPDGSGTVGNTYIYNSNTPDADITKQSTSTDADGGYWQQATSHTYFTLSGDMAAKFYPFETSDVFMKLIANYRPVVSSLTLYQALDVDTNQFYMSTDVGDRISKNDILKIDSEYMRVISVRNQLITVQRGFYGTTVAAHSATAAIKKSTNPGISQLVSKAKLKSGQEYILSFYAQDNNDTQTANQAFGALSLRINGGYINSSGSWQAPIENIENGYSESIDNITLEDRWIPFEDLTLSNDDSPLDSSSVETTNSMDHVWRKYEIVFTLPSQSSFSTDLSVEFCSRGLDDSYYYIDLVEMHENTLLTIKNDNSIIEASGLIDNEGRKDLMFYDRLYRSIRYIKNVFGDKDELKTIDDNIEYSPYATKLLSSSSIAIENRNREIHIGAGSNSGDSNPQWLGYLNHKLFGKDYKGILYQDEDTVHKYGGESSASLSKICVAGEHEYLTCSFSSPELTITHAGHSMNVGDNIVVREWGDTNNSWDGSGVWVVVTIAGDGNSFDCERHTTYDLVGSAPSNDKICYRPYYYYGCKDGDSHIYRITPSDKVNADSDDFVTALDTTYKAGKIERSMPLPAAISSIATSHNKDTTNGIGGGKIYAVSGESTDAYVVDVQLKHDSWTSTALSYSTLHFDYRSFKWSNARTDGNVTSSTGVFGGLAEESSPLITPNGVISDILETKGPTADFVHAATANTSNDLEHFDTRLWIQFSPREESFTEGARFLFCGKTTHDLTTTESTINMADRTPPTTLILGKSISYGGPKSSRRHRFISGPGQGPKDKLGDKYPDIEKNHEENEYSYFKNKTPKKGGYRKHFIGDIKVKVNAKPATYSENWWKTYGSVSGIIGIVWPYIQFGYNVGWDAQGGYPKIRVAKYGLFPIADNDKDGVLDGTGVVVPSTTSLATGNPYGNINQRVSAHAVGLIGGADTNWIRHWGKLRKRRGQGHPSGGRRNPSGEKYEDVPEQISLDKCIFICTDMHFGDHTPEATYAYTSISGVNLNSVGANTGTQFTISDTSKLQAGDLVYIKSSSGESYDTSTYIATIDSDTTFTVPLTHTTASGSSDAGTIYPHTSTIHRNFNVDRGQINPHQHFHWAFDEENENDGTIFTDGPACGHYTRTFYTTPSKVNGESSSMPGVLNRLEKLNYRAGFMIRPFNSSDELFEDLIVGNSTAVDMPGSPDAVYHVNNDAGGSDYLYYHVNDDAVNNQFASRLFVSSPSNTESNETNKSKIYICDPNFQYPDKENQVETEAGYSQHTTRKRLTFLHRYRHTLVPGLNNNSYNTLASWDVTIAGKLDKSTANGYIYAASATHVNAVQHPVLVIGGNSNILYNDDILGASALNRTTANSFAGMCITVLDAVTGTTQTRYIVGSRSAGNSATDDYYFDLHYPFGHIPAQNDYYYIWKHANVCTSPVRLLKQTELRHGLPNALIADPTLSSPMYKSSGLSVTDGVDSNGTTCTFQCSDFHNLTTNDHVTIKDATNTSLHGVYKITVTGPKHFTFASTVNENDNEATWELLSNSSSSAANPIKLDLANATLKTTFGGLDMRKLKSYTTRTADPSIDGDSVITGSDAEARLYFSANHLLSGGETITVQTSGTDAFDGTYIIKEKVDADEVDVYNPQTGDDDTNSIPITTNQWESIVSEKGSTSRLGELRSGFASWEMGNTAGNIIRYDTDVETSSFLNISESSVTIEAGSTTGDSDYFNKNTAYKYKISLVYDGYQEGPLSENDWTFEDTVTRDKLRVTIKVLKHSKRLTAVCLYRKDSVNNFYKLVREIPTNIGWAKSENNVYTRIIEDDGTLEATYESRTGISEILDTIKLKYGLSTEIDGYLFVGDCRHEKIQSATNIIFRSKPGMFSIFDYATDYLPLKSKPTAIANFNGSLYVFDENNIYRINPHSLSIEDTFTGVGCLNKDSVVVTEYGMFFADKFGAYIHDGSTPSRISEVIHKGGDEETTFGGTDNIKDVSWTNVVTNKDHSNVKVIFDSSSGSVLFNVEYYDSKATTTIGNLPKQIQYIWAYNILRNRWDLWELAENSVIGKPFNGDNGEVYYPINNNVYELMGGSQKRDYSWVSKKLTLAEDSRDKVFNKVKINGASTDLTSDGSNKESSPRLLVITDTGTVSNSDIVFSSNSDNHATYKLKGSNKKGKWMQFKFEDMTDSIDSVGLIFRKRSVK